MPSPVPPPDPATPPPPPADQLPAELAAEISEASQDPQRQHGRYLVLSELGRGGMGVVLRAWDPTMARLVAIKHIKAGPRTSPQELQRFKREALTVARLKHPGIVQVYEVFEHEDAPSIVMQLIEGKPLAHHLKAGITAKQAVTLMRQIALALQHAHDHGVVHRDLKPDNILLTATDGQPVILDFGLAKDLAGSEHLTSTGQILGTPTYMAPEQVDQTCGATGPAVDIWAAGIILYKALTGQAPFKADSSVVLFHKILTKDLEPLRSQNEAIPEELDQAVQRCLAKKAEDRYASASDLANELSRILESGSLADMTSKLTYESAQLKAPLKMSSRRLQTAKRTGKRTAERTTSSRRLHATTQSKKASSHSQLPVANIITAVTVAVMSLMAFVLLQKAQEENPVAAGSLGLPLALRCELSQPNDGLVSASHEVQVSGQVEPPVTTTLWIRNEEVRVSSGQLRHVLNLADGTHLITVTATQDGKPLAEPTIHVDTTDPVLVITSPSTNAILSGTTMLVSGTVDDENPRNISADGQAPHRLVKRGGFSLQLPLPAKDGRHQIELVADDKAGHETAANLSVVVDRTPPSIQVTGLAAGSVVRGNHLTVRGVVADAHPKTLSINGQDVPLGEEGQFSSEVLLNQTGEVTITLVATDAAGNHSQPLVKTVTNDRTPPQLTLDAPVAGLVTSANVIRVTGHASDTQGTVAVAGYQLTLPVSDDGQGKPTGWRRRSVLALTVSNNGRFEGNVLLEEGDNGLIITARDSMGNETTASCQVTCDTTPPTLELAPLQKEAWSGRRVKIPISGQVSEAGCTVTVNGEPVEITNQRFETSILNTATESFQEVTVQVTATDALGNTVREQLLALHFKDKVRRGWSGELLPPGLMPARRGKAKIYLWQPPAGPPLELVYVPPGEFIMGVSNEINKTLKHPNSTPAHIHPVPRGYWIGRFEVTRAQYHAFCRATGQEPPDLAKGRSERHPATKMTQTEAAAFCHWAKGLRLPTEAQWERAARGPNRSDNSFKYAWGSEEPTAEHCVGRDHNNVMPVDYACKDVSPNGVWHMTGNVSEWTADPYDSRAYTQYGRGDFTPPTNDRGHVTTRGGYMGTQPDRINVVYRDYQGRNHSDWRLGFRVVLLSTTTHSDRSQATTAPLPKSFGGITKIVKWDPEKRIGSFKHQNKYFAFQLDADTPVRIDHAIPVTRWQYLNEVAPTAWCFAVKDTYGTGDAQSYDLKPRRILSAGYGMEPLPEGERATPGLKEELRWHTATDVDWARNGTGKVGGVSYRLGLNSKDLVMFGKRGNPDDLRKGLSIYLTGPIEITHPLSSSGKVLSHDEAQKFRSKVLNAPLIRAQRLVVLHKAFMKDYPLCFEETFMSGTKD